MEIVIDIDDDIYKSVVNNDDYVLEEDVDWILLENAIANGTPLPKGHGKLIDENELKKEAIRCEWSRSMYGTLEHTLSYMKPIIEADKGGKR